MVKEDSENDGNKQITTTCTCVQYLSCASTKFTSDIISMCVVPVQIRHPDSNKVLHTYARLENYSQSTFVMEAIFGALGIPGSDTRIIVKTLNGDISQMITVVENLKVTG